MRSKVHFSASAKLSKLCLAHFSTKIYELSWIYYNRSKLRNERASYVLCFLTLQKKIECADDVGNVPE